MIKNIICEKRRAFICEYAHMTICKNISVGAVNMRRLDCMYASIGGKSVLTIQ